MTLTDSQCDAAAALLFGQWRAGRQIDHLPPELRPSSRAEAYAVQARLEARFAEVPIGWKIAATSRAGQAHINVGGPLAGRIFRERTVANGASVPLDGNAMRVAELEFAFGLDCDLPPRDGGYGPGMIRDAVATLHPAIEIPASRFRDFCAVGEAALIADNACAHLFLFGPAFDAGLWRGRDLARWEVTATVAGKPAIRGIGGNVLGDPWVALHWLVNECTGQGITLRRGQLISTGTCVTPVAVAPGDRLAADFGLGAPLALTFA